MNDTFNVPLIELIITSSGGNYLYLQSENEGLGASSWRWRSGVGLVADAGMP